MRIICTSQVGAYMLQLHEILVALGTNNVLHIRCDVFGPLLFPFGSSSLSCVLMCLWTPLSLSRKGITHDISLNPPRP
jgi:hypothetical protein